MSEELETGCGCVFGIIFLVIPCIEVAFEIHLILGVISTVLAVGFFVFLLHDGVFSQSINTYSSSDINKILEPPQITLPPDVDLTSLSRHVNVQKLEIQHSLRLEITQNLNPKKKENYDSFRQVLLGHGISCFYHFTDERNLENIRKYGGLISWYSCAKHEIGVTSAGGDSLSRNLDVRYGLQDYVRLSFCRDHPMAYKHKLAGKNLVLLQIKIDVALWEETLFSNMNATDNEHSHGSSLNDLKRIDFAAVKKNYVSRDDEDFKYHQAEILVKTAIPKEFIVNLDNPIYL